MIEKRINIIFFSLSAISFLILIIRNFYVPMAHDEIGTFFTYIQIGEFLPYKSYIDANNHILNSFLSWISYKLFGASPFALRLPNLIFFPVLVFSTYKLLAYFNTFSAKILLTSVLLFSFNWLSFYSLCRGYGISMSLLVLSLYFFISYFQSGFQLKHFLGFVVVIQFAISANLTLQIITILLTSLLLLYHLISLKINNWKIVSIYVFNFLSLKFWVDYSFYLKQNGALYYGTGESYWKVTFDTLIGLIIGHENFWVNLVVTFLFALVLLMALYYQTRSITSIKSQLQKPNPFLLISLTAFALILGFYAMKILLGINYPEDRAALFFYPIFMIITVYLVDYLKIEKVAISISLIFVIHFLLSINFEKHTMLEYESLPDKFYTTLKKEQEKTENKITIGNHRQTKQFFLAYANYLDNGNLNYSDVQDEINPYCDYYLGALDEEKKLNKNYLKIAFDKNWGFGLFKRRNEIKKTKIYELNEKINVNNEQEFYDMIKWKDTLLPNIENSVLLFEFEFDVKNASKPFSGIFILDIKSKNEKNSCYKSFTMNHQKFDWNNTKSNKYSILSPVLKNEISQFSFYFWNKRKQEIEMSITKFAIYRLNQ